jgi:hypothetical protein
MRISLPTKALSVVIAKFSFACLWLADASTNQDMAKE